MLIDAMDIFTCEPRNDLLNEREGNEAYCTAHAGREYAVFFPNGGEVTLDLGAVDGAVTLRWLHVLNSQWQAPVRARGPGTLTLACPTTDYWVVLIQKQELQPANGSNTP